MKLHSMWQTYPELAKELKMTSKLMESSVNLKNKPVEDAILAMIHSGGKMLRPAYQLLFSQFGPERDQKKATALAASIEMLHTATLIHDDIVDRSSMRRGVTAINASFGNEVAVYAGDYLFVLCFKLLSDYAGSLRSLQLNSRSMEKILGGELGQMDSRYHYEIGVEQYLENISGKTAELFQLSCFVGAYESGNKETFAKKSGEIGLAIGMAFQIIDDILDYSQSATDIGKPVLEDVRQGVYSLPLLIAFEKNPAAFKPLLNKKAEMTDQDAQEIFQLVQQYDGVAGAQVYAEQYTNQAIAKIKKLPANQYNTRENLETITKTILTREN
ncbi:polyprenyl synthetase family protein [Enterococcus sp. HY326]|uniref:polyprenyl synthetase family protein n=1 Tax=Enterococcus sp. HY326 TaxID=2971265 RepID=UPI0022401DC4|nr:polyprenyl synthetase family protein [Enterococcus sp. HY326]